MADNYVTSAGSGGNTYAADDIGGIHFPRVKISWGVNGAQVDASATDPFPIDVISALPAGTNAIGKLAANSGVDIGDVDVTSLIPGVAATSLGKAEDAAHSSGDVGVMSLTVRQNTAASTSGADGDYQPLISDTNGRLHVLDANSADIKASVQIMDDWDESDRAKVNVIAGQAGIAGGTGTDGATVVRVTLATDIGLPAGTNVIGKLGANSGVDIGDVDVTSVVPGTGATNLGKAVDSAAGAADTGVVPLAIRDDALGGLSEAAGDYVPPRVDANGALWVKPSGTVTVAGAITNAGTFVVQEDGAALTALQLIDDVVAVDDTTTHATGTTKGVNIMAAATPTDGSVAANDIGQVAMSTDRRLHVDAQIVGTDAALDVSGATVTVDGSGVTQPVSGTVTANLSATDNAVLDAIVTNQSARATGGHSFYLNQDTNAVASVKASAGTIYWIACMSTDATPVYLNLYNVASGSVTLGSTTPNLQFIVPSQGDANGSGFTINFGPHGIQFGTAITVACATTYNGSADPGANVVITNIGFE